jgi:glycosyltransferase involved in cell wall biosynthesis
METNIGNITPGTAKNTAPFALVTPAWNEEALIEKPIQAVIAQTVLPVSWVIVSDGSTDRTDEIVQSYADRYDFIHLYRMPNRHKRSFAAQVDAINAGYDQIRHLRFNFIGNLDSDISFEPDYFERLLQHFDADPTLGMAGGSIYEKKKDGVFYPRRLNRPHSVLHGVQMFRRECFDDLGGYKPLRHGSPDWHAEVCLRMRGRKVWSIPGLKAFHHRPNGAAGNMTWYFYRQGMADYALGTHPLFEMFKIARRVRSKPYVLGSAAEFAGFVHAYFKREKRVVPPDFIAFLRKEQLARLRPSAWPSEWRKALGF